MDANYDRFRKESINKMNFLSIIDEKKRQEKRKHVSRYILFFGGMHEN